MMGAGIGQIFVLLLLTVGIIVPFWKILPRAGISRYVALVSWVPLVPLILLWFMAFKTWPGDDNEEGAA